MNLNSIEKTLDDNQYQQVANFLLTECQFCDFKLVLRHGLDGQTYSVIYVAAPTTSKTNVDFEQVLSVLGNKLGRFKPQMIVPITAIPYDKSGQLELAKLTALPIFNQAYINHKYPQVTLSQQSQTQYSVVSYLLGESVSEATQPLALMRGSIMKPDVYQRKNLLDALALCAKGNNGIRFIQSAQQSEHLSYQALQRQAMNIAYGLVAEGVKKGDQVVLQVKELQDTVLAVWGAWYAGASVIPLACGQGLDLATPQVKRYLTALNTFPEAKVICDANMVESQTQFIFTERGSAHPVMAIDALKGCQIPTTLADVKGDDIAFYLMTSGSTAEAKIVPQSHHRILQRSIASQQFNRFKSLDVSLNWLPLEHVGGIVMFHIQDTITGCEQIQCPTQFILADPLRWMQLCDQFNVTITWAPNFAYQLFNSKAKQVTEQQWDLSALHFILNGGEAIVAEQAHQFLQLMKPHGLSPQAMNPSWGMSETCSGVTFSHTFSQTPPQAAYTSVGLPVPGIDIRIVDEAAQLKTYQQSGRLQIKGESILTGYFDNDRESQTDFTTDGWFDTGDLAFIDERGLTITGRNKDVLVINGNNVAYHELESCIDKVAGVEPSNTCVFALNEGGVGDEQLCVVANSELTGEHQQSLFSDIQSCLRRQYGVDVYQIYLLAANQIEKTSIGKIQRNKLRQKVLKQQLSPLWSAAVIANTRRVETRSCLQQQCFQRQWQRENGHSKSDIVQKVAIFCHSEERLNAFATVLALHHIEVLGILPEYVSYSGENCQLIRVNPTCASAWQQVLTTFNQQGGVERFIFAPDTYGVMNASINVQYNTFMTPLISLLQGIELSQFSAPFIALSSAGQTVLESDKPVVPMVSTITSFIRAANEEIRHFNGLCLDTTEENCTNDLLNELAMYSTSVEVAYRHGQRYISKLAHVNMAAVEHHEPKDKYYLVFGGLGGIGAHLIKKLANTAHSRVVVVGRTAIGVLSAKKRNQLAGFRMLAGQVDYVVGDITNFHSLKSVFGEAMTLLDGKIDHIFQLAGDFNSELIKDISLAQYRQGLSAKIEGSQTIYDLSKEFGITRLTLFSSANGYLSGTGVASYSAANRYQEALAELAMTEKQLDVRCLNWSMWQGTGLSEGFVHTELTESKGYVVFTPEQGMAVLPCLLKHQAKNCLIGINSALQPMQKELWLEPMPLQYSVSSTPISEPIFDPFGTVLPVSVMTENHSGDSPVKVLSAIWCQVLELDSLDVESNLFDLGANSLLLPQVMTEVNDVLGIEITLVDLFQYPTTQSLAEFIAQMLPDSNHHTEVNVDSIAHQLVLFWQRTLDIEEVSFDENVFEIGANSLLLPKLVEFIDQEFAVEVTLVDLFQYPNVAQLAEFINVLVDAK